MSDFMEEKLLILYFSLRFSFIYVYSFTAKAMSVNPAVTYLILFYAASMVIFIMYGGGFATIPAYLADIFGTKYVGGIHGRLLTAWSTAGVLGPVAITQLRQGSVETAIQDLVSKISPDKFQEIYGASVDQLSLLVKQKTVTISNLCNICRKELLTHPQHFTIQQCMLWPHYLQLHLYLIY